MFPIKARSNGGKSQAGLPGKGHEGRGRQATWGRGVLLVKGIDELFRMSKVCSRFPTIVTRIITFPFDKVLILVTVFATVENVFNFIF